jgi:ABC-type uncharacterized transport system permease subunit
MILVFPVKPSVAEGAIGALGSAGYAYVLWIPSALALLAYLAAAVVAGRGERGASRTLWLAWAAHALAIVVDIGGLGSAQSGARFGFAPALSATVWLVIGVYALEGRSTSAGTAWRVLALAAAAVVAMAAVFPGEFRAQAGSPWAPLHWVLGLASYGLFGAAVLHAALQAAGERRMRSRGAGRGASTELGMPLLMLERLTFRFVGAGFVLLTAAIVLGWWALPQWRWDHKAVFSLMGWVVFAGLLVGRRAFGWRGRRAARWLYAGAGLLLLAYVGSRFVLEVVLQRTAG